MTEEPLHRGVQTSGHCWGAESEWIQFILSHKVTLNDLTPPSDSLFMMTCHDFLIKEKWVVKFFKMTKGVSSHLLHARLSRALAKLNRFVTYSGFLFLSFPILFSCQCSKLFSPSHREFVSHALLQEVLLSSKSFFSRRLNEQRRDSNSRVDSLHIPQMHKRRCDCFCIVICPSRTWNMA